jgi:hypothetical protein
MLCTAADQDGNVASMHMTIYDPQPTTNSSVSRCAFWTDVCSHIIEAYRIEVWVRVSDLHKDSNFFAYGRTTLACRIWNRVP